MKVRHLVFVCGGLLTVVGLVNAEQQEKDKIKAPTTWESGRLDQHISELMARRIVPATIASDELAIDRLEAFHDRMEDEENEFPADELYNSVWDTVHVNPFKRLSLDYPDTYTVDCRAFTMPLDNKIKVTSNYGPRRRRMHRGIDLDLEKGDTVRAAFDGKVRIKSYERRGYGYYVVLRHANGLETVYGHLSQFLTNENQNVHAGEPIALGGNTGRSTGSHLHFEIRFLGRDLDPAELIDFANGVPHRDEYVFHNIPINGQKSNMYATSAGAIAVHRVLKGETLASIARRYGTTISDLCTLNNLSQAAKLTVGQAICFRAKPVTIEASPTHAIQQTTKNAVKTENKSLTPKTAPNKPVAKKMEAPVEKTAKPSETTYHSIQAGDTLYSLAKRYGLTVEKLCELNNFQDNTILKVGSKIRCS